MAILDVQVIDLGKQTNGKFKAKNSKRIIIGMRDEHTPDHGTRVPVTPKEAPLVVPQFPKEKTSLDFDINDWHSFGKDNLFPEGLAAINRQAINQRSILHWKAIYTVGKGFMSKDEKLLEYLKKVNNQNETFRKVFKRIIQDYNGFGNAYVEVVTDTLRTFTWIFQWDATKVRLGRRTRQGFVGLFADWKRVQGRQDQIKWVPLYPDFELGEDGLLHSIVHIRSYEPEFPNYGLPTWLAGMDAAAIGFKTNKWNITRLDNQFQSSGVLEIYGDKSDKKLKEKIDKFKKERVGEGNNAQLLIITKERGGDASVYTPLIQTNEGDWLNLHKQSDQDIVMAHNWFRSLSGLGEPGQLGNTQQIRNEYQIARETVIPEIQNIILDEIKPVFEMAGFSTEDLEVINKSPISLADKINVNMLLTRGEGYKIMGIEPDKNDPDLDKTIQTSRAKVEEIKQEDATQPQN